MFRKKYSATDCSVNDLPHNRKEVFFDVLRLHFFDLIKCGAILLIFALPLIAAIIYADIVVADFSERVREMTESELILDEIKAMIAFDNTIALIEIPLFAVLFIGFAAVARIIRQYAFLENVYIRYDFKEGLKQNVVQMIILGCILGFLHFISGAIRNYLAMAFIGSEQYFTIIPSVIFVTIFVPVIIFTAVCITIYNNGFLLNLRIGFVIYGDNILKTILLLIVSTIPFGLLLIPNIIVKIASYLVIVMISPIPMLGWWLVSYNYLDKRINNINHIELIGKGTFKNDSGVKENGKRKR